jgi:hypothetical protein
MIGEVEVSCTLLLAASQTSAFVDIELGEARGCWESCVCVVAWCPEDKPETQEYSADV